MRFERLGLLAALLACLMAAGCGRTPLYSDLNEQQANELMAALLGAGIPAEKSLSVTQKSWEVSVGEHDIPQAMQVLGSQGLPRAEYRSLGDVFKKEGFASSALEEKARYLYGLSQELSRTLSRIDGVVEARVHIALPDQDPLGAQAQDSSASVIVFERPGAGLRSRETDIKVFVKDSIEGLDDVNKVTVKFFTVGGKPAPVERDRVAVALAAVSPAAAVVAFGLLLLAGLGWTLRARLTGRLTASRRTPPPVAPAWKD